MNDYRACCEATDGGTRLRIRVSPRAKRTQASGLHGSALRVRLGAPPVDGKANEALVDWLTDVLGVRASDVRLVRGERSRDKEVVVMGLRPDVVARHLADGG